MHQFVRGIRFESRAVIARFLSKGIAQFLAREGWNLYWYTIYDSDYFFSWTPVWFSYLHRSYFLGFLTFANVANVCEWCVSADIHFCVHRRTVEERGYNLSFSLSVSLSFPHSLSHSLSFSRHPSPSPPLVLFVSPPLPLSLSHLERHVIV